MGNPKNTRNKFWTNVDKRGPTECWHWTAALSATGYGNYRENYKQYGAHRYAYIDAYGDPGQGVLVRHKCDNRRCVNPNHLETGSYADNNRDTVVRGRSLTGERNHAAKLTEQDVIEMRKRAAAGESNGVLTDEFGVSRGAVDHAVSGRSWKHLDTPPVVGRPRRRRKTKP